MKKILLIGLLLLVSYGLQAQSWTLQASTYQTDTWAVTSWKPFTTDSTSTEYTAKLTLGKYDSIYCWVRTSATANNADFTATLQATFDGSNYQTSGGQTACDSTASKLGYLTFAKGMATNGMPMGRIAVVPNTTGTATYKNAASTSINFYLVCRKRLNE